MTTTTHAIGTTAAEAEVLAATQAAIAAGGDPFGDDDSGEGDDASGTGDENSAAAAQFQTGDATDGSELTAEQLAAIAGEDDETPAGEDHVAEDHVDEPVVRQYRTNTPEELAQSRKELREKKNKAFKDYSDGVIDAEEYSRIDDEVADALEQLTVQRTLHTANEQTKAETQESVLDSIIQASKAAGEVDYHADAAAAKQFDAAMAMIAADGKQRTYAQLAKAAHKAVLDARGITPKAGDTTEGKPEAARARENGKGPVTLREVPAASVPNAGGTWQDQLKNLTGQAYQEAFEALTPAQKASLLD